MREYIRGTGTLSRLPLASKILYIGFLLLTLAAFANSLLLYYDSMGWTAAEAATWYLGNEDQEDALEMVLEKSPRELLEVSHFHLYTMPVLLLVLGHLFLLARGGAWKLWVIVLASLFTALHVAGPWIVYFGGPSWGWVMPLTGGPFLGLYLFLALWPLPDLLRRPPSR